MNPLPGHYLNPTNDYAFKRIFGSQQHPEILVSFLNSILQMEGPERIVSVQQLNPLQTPRIPDLKETILDVRCKDQADREFIVEMQLSNQEDFGKRALYYASKSYVQQLNKHQEYHKLEPVYFVGILGFRFLESKDYLSTHVLLNRETGEHTLRDYRFTFVELPKFTKSEKELKETKDKWTYFLKHAPELVLHAIPSGLKDEKIEEAFEVLEEIGQSREQLEVYEYLGMKREDQVLQMKYSYKEGEKKGVVRGERRGMKKGLQKGHEQGEMKGKAQAVLTILEARGMRATPSQRNQILSCTDLTTLEQWVHKAAIAHSIQEVLG